MSRLNRPLSRWELASISFAILVMVDPATAIAFAASFVMFAAPRWKTLPVPRSEEAGRWQPVEEPFVDQGTGLARL